jgi:competence protein ComEC
MRGRWGEVPFAALTGSLALGITASPLLFHCLFGALALAAGLMIAAAALALARNRPDACLALGLCATALGGVLLGLAERDGYAWNDVRALLASRSLPLDEQLLLDGCALEDSSERGPDLVTAIEMRGFRRRDSWVPCKGTTQLRVAIPADGSVPLQVLQYGDRVRVWAECYLPQNFANPGSPDRAGTLARRGIFMLARSKSPRLFEVLRHDCGTPWGHAVASVRRALQERIGRLRLEGNPQRAAVLSSVVLGSYVDLSAETRTDFQNTGTFHVLVVSGLHVSTIAWILTMLFRLMRVPVSGSRLLAACGIFFFTSLVGFQASMTRALWMFLLYLIGQSIFRRAAPGNIVLACAFLLLSVHPGWLRDTGFQLSFLSVTAIVLMGMPAIERFLFPLLDPLRHAGKPDKLSVQADRWHRLGRLLRFRAELLAESCSDRMRPEFERVPLAVCRFGGVLGFFIGSMFLVSLSVQAWLEPLLAYDFNRLSWIAPVANLVVVPLSSLVLAAGMFAAALTSLVPAAWPAFRFAGFCSGLLLEVNRWFSSLPGASQRCPTPHGWWVIGGLLLLSAWCFLRWRRIWIPCAFVVLEIAALSLAGLRLLEPPGIHLLPSSCRSWFAVSPQRLRFAFLDVGQGDSIIIEFPDGRVWVVDAGGLRVEPGQPEETSPFDIGEAVVSRFLWSRWDVALDRAILTHPHQDHAGGLPVLLRNFPTARLDLSDTEADPARERILEAARVARVPAHPVGRGDEFMHAGVQVTVLNPDRAHTPRSLNDTSVVLHLRYGRFSALLAGDMEGPAESWLLSSGLEFQSQLLKVAHHGSRNTTSDGFLDRVRPRWAVISAGRNNPFQNPSRETLLRLLRHGTRFLLTMEHGAIFFETDGSNYSLSSYRLGPLERGQLR